jgi:hypothetical protein
VLAVLWALLLATTRGVVLPVGETDLTSRSPQNGLIVVLIAGLGTMVLAWPSLRLAFGDDAVWWRNLASASLAEAVRRRGPRLIG